MGLFLVGLFTFVLLLMDGLGLAGYNPPVMWAMYITTFVFWVGIGHAGTLISAILFLFRAQWRTSIYRATEAMTVFAVMTAGLFPIIHIGRQWIFYWLLPYPNQRYLWPNFKSPLLWDVFAISTYLTVSTTFLIVGLVPDIAAVRDQVTGWRKKLYGACSLGWTGTDNQWRHYTRGYLYLAALATPLVLSVHSVVSWDFAMSIIPGWHGTIFAPYFVAGAIYSGIGMVFTLMIPLRKMLQRRAHDRRLPLRQPGQADALRRLDPVLRLRDGVLRRLVQREHLRADHLLAPRLRADVVGGVEHDHLQRLRVAAALVQEDPDQPDGAVRHLDLHQHRDVVRAVRHHRLVAQQRLRALVVGPAESRPGPTGASWPAPSAGSGCTSCSSPGPSRSWRSRKSRKRFRSPRKRGGH